MIADEERQKRHGDQRPDTRAIEEHGKEDDTAQRRSGVERMTARQFCRLRGDIARELAEGDDRAGEGHGADKDPEEDLELEYRLLDRILMGKDRGKAFERLTLFRAHRQNAA